MKILVMYSLGPPSKGHLERLSSLREDLDVVVATDEASALSAVPEAEIVLGHRYLRQALPFAEQLRWVQSSAGGVDRLPLKALAQRDVTVTRTPLFAHVIANHALSLAWALTRALPAATVQQGRGRWNQDLPFLPMPRKALVLGLGNVGRAIAERLGREEIRVTGARRTRGESARNLCEEIHDAGSWRSALPETDWCFLALPRTRETEGLFDEEAMRALPAHAILVNVGRGETLDTAALLRVLSDGHLGGAALDVIDPKPADAKDPIWHAPRLLMTPHVAAHFPGRLEMVEHFFEEQVARYLDGLPLEAAVDLESLVG